MRTIFILSTFLLCQWMYGHTFGFDFTSDHKDFVASNNPRSASSNLEEIGKTEATDILKSAINITSPNSSSIWTIPGPVELEWNTKNIGTDKSIRFFLAKDDMVVQELGTFKNSGNAGGIILAKNISSGNNYQVVGIEMFPDDKFHIAKVSTPYFSIKNKESDARKEQYRLLNASKTNTVAKVKTPQKSEKPKITEAPQRMEFDGRNITYVKELSFKNEKIKIKIWDHGRQDGDIVSVYLNGFTIISKHLLTYSKKQIEITLDPNKKNDLFLYAHNLGKYAPNTVSVEITDGISSENIILNSDLKSCEAVMISVNK
ncbi:hypothetical protein HPE56_17565 [Maribacter sp. ANRC-HE7]|uniref:Uncharacterized protein n=1 Tax=Maribacter aquimaris TaxID=2737171 RepID=A0ABR7V8Y5_9FLAO|nr:hypothetical protein [Maribacter aquimaris]MBD0779613.1 hypothetical protein [Maribacter aquimaris]